MPESAAPERRVTRIPPVDPEVVRNRDLHLRDFAPGLHNCDRRFKPCTVTGSSRTGELPQGIYAFVLSEMKRITETGYRKKWVLENGSIPKGHLLHHIDGNRRNNAVANLALLTYRQHARLHSLIRQGLASYGDMEAVERVRRQDF